MTENNILLIKSAFETLLLLIPKIIKHQNGFNDHIQRINEEHFNSIESRLDLLFEMVEKSLKKLFKIEEYKEYQEKLEEKIINLEKNYNKTISKIEFEENES